MTTPTKIMNRSAGAALGLRSLLVELPGDLRRLGGQLAHRAVAEHVVSDPSPTVLAVLRRVRPRLRVKRLTVLTGADDVIDVLHDEERYRVAPYAEAMQRLIGPFALGLDGEAHARSRARLDEAFTVVDLDELARWADAKAAALVADARDDSRIDVVTELGQPLAVAFVARWYGVPDAPFAPAAPEERMAVWATTFFEDCFLNLTRDRVVGRRAARASARLRAVVGSAVAERIALPEAPGDSRTGSRTTVLDRLLGTTGSAEAAEDATVDLVGLIVATVPMIAEALTRTVDHLLDSPDERERAASAAARGDREQVWRHIQESLRFSSPSPGVLRSCPVADATAGNGDPHGRPDLVLASTRSAMFDPARVPHPRRYLADRPEHVYLHFGAGPHACLGRPFARELLISATGALLREQGLARRPRPDGTMISDGPAVARLTVAL